MKKLNEILEKLHGRFPKANSKVIDTIVGEYQKGMLDLLVDRGRVYIHPGIKLEIVPITPRRYMLRGTEYKSKYVYKLKATITDDAIYDRIAGEYNQFREDL